MEDPAPRRRPLERCTYCKCLVTTIVAADGVEACDGCWLALNPRGKRRPPPFGRDYWRSRLHAEGALRSDVTWKD